MNSPARQFIPLFPSHRESEAVIWVIHKHWLLLAYPLGKTLAVFLFSLFLPLWWKALGLFLFSFNFLIFLYLLWLVFWAGYSVYQYLVWQADRAIITSERIIHFATRSLANRRMQEVALEQVQEITYLVRGWGAALLRFGDVIIRSHLGEMVLERVPFPDRIQSQLTLLVKEVTEEPPVTVEELVKFLKEHRA